MCRSRVSTASLVVLIGAFAPAANAVSLQTLVAARWVGPAGPVPVTEGTFVNAAFNPYIMYDVAVRVSEGDNMGLGSVMFDTRCQVMAEQGLYMWPFYDAESGYSNMGAYPGLRDVTDPAYPAPQPTFAPASYGGGWGFDNQGSPTGGMATAPGQVMQAGNSVPPIWTGDNAPWLPGLQSSALLGVGQGSNVGRPEDPTFGGTQLGRQTHVDGPMPQDLANGMVPGDGEWVMFRTWLDVQFTGLYTYYTVSVTPTFGTYLMFESDFTGDSAGLTYYDELNGGYLAEFDTYVGDRFRFWAVPEPGTVGLLLVGGLALIRRQR